MIRLDSRFITLGDCFAQRFAAPGRFRYFVVLGRRWFDTAEGTEANTYEIEVALRAAGTAQPSQQNVLVSRSADGLVAEPGNVHIQTGDAVCWYTTDSSLQGFSIFGDGDRFRFDSTSITGEAFYTHVFGLPGRYEWVDANHGVVRGVVEVKQLTAATAQDRQRLFEEMKKPNLVEVSGTSVTPGVLDITVGQTVFWHVQDSPGITITDPRLLHTVNPQPLPP
jgi:plastocyanin